MKEDSLGVRPMSQTCRKCDRWLPLKAFPVRPTGVRSGICGDCRTLRIRAKRKRYYDKNRDAVLARGKARRDAGLPEKYRYSLWLGWTEAKVKRKATEIVRSAHCRAKTYRVPFSLTRDWALPRLMERRCEVTGIEFEWERGRPGPFAPSIDRCVPSEGYTPENCRMVVWSYNLAKGSGSHEDVIKLAKALLGRSATAVASEMEALQ